MQKSTLAIIIGAIIIFAGIAFLAWRSGQTDFIEPKQSRMILFYGNGCPHCEKVDLFVQQNRVDLKLSFEKREVFYDKNNANLMRKRVESCGLSTKPEDMGVPLFWDGKSCYNGDIEIINYFNEKLAAPTLTEPESTTSTAPTTATTTTP